MEDENSWDRLPACRDSGGRFHGAAGRLYTVHGGTRYCSTSTITPAIPPRTSWRRLSAPESRRVSQTNFDWEARKKTQTTLVKVQMGYSLETAVSRSTSRGCRTPRTAQARREQRLRRYHLLYCNPAVCAVCDHMLSESKKEHVKKRPEPNAARTRCEIFQRSRIHHSRRQSILQNKIGVRCSWKKHRAVLQTIYQPKINRRIHDNKKCPWTNPIWSRS